MEAPYWLYTSYLLACQIPNAYDRYEPRNFYPNNYSDELRAVLTVYLHDTFQGIKFNKEALCCANKTEMKFHVLQAKEEFSKAIDNRFLTDGRTVLQHNVRIKTDRHDVLRVLWSNFLLYDEVCEEKTLRFCLFRRKHDNKSIFLFPEKGAFQTVFVTDVT